MKKIVMADALKPFTDNESGLFRRAAVQIFAADTNDSLLEIHRREKANLIISRVDLPGMASEQLYTLIRNDAELRRVSTIICCSDDAVAREAAARCKPNIVMTMPLDEHKLAQCARELLQVSARESYRVLLSVQIEGSSKDRPFFCKSENISASGMLLETERVLAIGDGIVCSFFLPGSHRISATGDVVRDIGQQQNSTNRYGVKFTQVSAQDKAAIEQFVQKKAQLR